ncbi:MULTISPECIES: EutN/CcmL family microcompartment protein [Aneurinibacillus]|uniref:Ethanolamine utilization protein EutN n=1 Tax=Aneurinibacillus thermoaerophilus TaxID=143495 RepID=A0A1G7X6D5_ANETH|nr:MULTISPECIES: EutN/CcmL family microcompartment protein [Aneurinibacillus]AMA73222.1 ethanolamine utilization protein EutN [Aneurinibacillus sp. XH2]MED0674352.1 EutN/CcmL family microcompartment protein [Aneurinibacillus thermoaerophilus]MED0678370.1 EutN/CcmL family microcompartment protein [Aneurinibacillus thermoaerophilus]MED0736105.1 EutN/CcmL family microcompartment protein [Aneurinibacillus thermoaerophilus]MED0756949.1 EutN/CcmL family microcompartment protein [Aneurinibacillus the
MRIGTVVGNVWATRKEDGLTGLKFLFVQLEDTKGVPVDVPLIAADRIGAGIGDTVMVTLGSAARFVISEKDVPIDAVVIGIVDSIDVESR